mgnify:CR=1 FL=1
MVKLSIIIPVYNGEEYIDRCLQSCLRQDIPADSYEIIVVDDGSTDSSNVILSRYAMEHANVVVLTQSNKKQGAARNYGLSKAQGEYIWFVDSDDWIEANCLGRLLALCDDNGIEVLAIDRINTDGKSFQEKLKNKKIPLPIKFFPDSTSSKYWIIIWPFASICGDVNYCYSISCVL